jgi:hypothetical protein
MLLLLPLLLPVLSLRLVPHRAADHCRALLTVGTAAQLLLLPS